MLRIDLREGFQGDTVEIHVDGTRVRVEEDVRTRNQIGLARQIQVELPRQPSRVEVRLPARGLRAGLEVDSRRTPNLGVDVGADGQLRLTPSAQEFGYV